MDASLPYPSTVGALWRQFLGLSAFLLAPGPVRDPSQGNEVEEFYNWISDILVLASFPCTWAHLPFHTSVHTTHKPPHTYTQSRKMIY